MSNRGQEAICIRRKIHSFNSGFQVKHSSDKRWVLMTESVVFLTCPCACFDVIETSDVFSPFAFCTHFDEFGVLDHHSMYNSEESLI
jgi:hypothetical protein